MSMTSRTSGTSRFERAAALRIMAFPETSIRVRRRQHGCRSSLCIARFCLSVQGLSGIYRRMYGIRPAPSEAFRRQTGGSPHPAAAVTSLPPDLVLLGQMVPSGRCGLKTVVERFGDCPVPDAAIDGVRCRIAQVGVKDAAIASLAEMAADAVDACFRVAAASDLR